MQGCSSVPLLKNCAVEQRQVRRRATAVSRLPLNTGHSKPETNSAGGAQTFSSRLPHRPGVHRALGGRRSPPPLLQPGATERSRGEEPPQSAEKAPGSLRKAGLRPAPPPGMRRAAQRSHSFTGGHQPQNAVNRDTSSSSELSRTGWEKHRCTRTLLVPLLRHPPPAVAGGVTLSWGRHRLNPPALSLSVAAEENGETLTVFNSNGLKSISTCSVANL